MGILIKLQPDFSDVFKKSVLFSQAAIKDHSSCFIDGRGLARLEPPGRGIPIQSEHLRGGDFKINYSAASPKHEGISNRVAMVSFGIVSPCHHVGKCCFPVFLSYLFFIVIIIAETLRQSVDTYLTS